MKRFTVVAVVILALILSIVLTSHASTKVVLLMYTDEYWTESVCMEGDLRYTSSSTGYRGMIYNLALIENSECPKTKNFVNGYYRIFIGEGADDTAILGLLNSNPNNIVVYPMKFGLTDHAYDLIMSK